jgi:hypothetical protein
MVVQSQAHPRLVLDEEQPMAGFKSDELVEVTGQVK